MTINIATYVYQIYVYQIYVYIRTNSQKIRHGGAIFVTCTYLLYYDSPYRSAAVKL